MNVLVVGDIHGEAERLLSKKLVVTKITEGEFKELSNGEDYDVLVVRTFTKLGKGEFMKLGNLRYVG